MENLRNVRSHMNLHRKPEQYIKRDMKITEGAALGAPSRLDETHVFAAIPLPGCRRGGPFASGPLSKLSRGGGCQNPRPSRIWPGPNNTTKTQQTPKKTHKNQKTNTHKHKHTKQTNKQ